MFSIISLYFEPVSTYYIWKKRRSLSRLPAISFNWFAILVISSVTSRIFCTDSFVVCVCCTTCANASAVFSFDSTENAHMVLVNHFLSGVNILTFCHIYSLCILRLLSISPSFDNFSHKQKDLIETCIISMRSLCNFLFGEQLIVIIT